MIRVSRRVRWIASGLGLGLLLVVISSVAIQSLVATHRAVATFTALLGAANSQDLDGLRRLCTDRYLRTHPLVASPGGGVVGLPRSIHKNFQVWREGDEVWLCPTNRVGPVYRFVFQDRTCRFDGLVGLLRPGGSVDRVVETSTEEIF